MIYVFISTILIRKQLFNYFKMQQMRIYQFSPLTNNNGGARIETLKHSKNIPKWFLFQPNNKKDRYLIDNIISKKHCCSCCKGCDCCCIGCGCCTCFDTCCNCCNNLCGCCNCRSDCCDNGVKCGIIAISTWQLIVATFGVGFSLYLGLWILLWWGFEFVGAEYMPVFYIWIGTYIHLLPAIHGIAVVNYQRNVYSYTKFFTILDNFLTILLTIVKNVKECLIILPSFLLVAFFHLALIEAVRNMVACYIFKR